MKPTLYCFLPVISLDIVLAAHFDIVTCGPVSVAPSDVVTPGPVSVAPLDVVTPGPVLVAHLYYHKSRQLAVDHEDEECM